MTLAQARALPLARSISKRSKLRRRALAAALSNA
jgi:hypothetical protein